VAVREVLGQELKQQKRRLVGPMQVVKDQHERLRTGQTLQERCDGVK
jgi:hypothetical protein